VVERKFCDFCPPLQKSFWLPPENPLLALPGKKRKAEKGTQIGKTNVVLHELHRSVVTKRELSSAAKLSVFKLVFVAIFTVVVILGK